MIKSIIKKILSTYGLEIRPVSPETIYDRVVTISNKEHRGNALVSYVIEPFVTNDSNKKLNSHTHFGESVQIVDMLLEMGYSVDVVSFRNNTFIPQKKYDLFIGARTNFDHITCHLNKDCIKIAHLDVSHWIFNNTAAYNRALALQQRRKVSVPLYRKVLENSWAIENCDFAVVIGNDHTESTYAYARKKIFQIMVPAMSEYPWEEEKDFKQVKKNYLWLGSDGLIHRGVDLLLEVFSSLPDYKLTICGPVKEDFRFEQAFHKELYETENIVTNGWIDINSEDFFQITQDSVSMIYPSAAEGQAGSVITCMQAGLIPIVSVESGIFDVEKYGFLLRDCSHEEIKQSVVKLSGLNEIKLKEMSRKVWHHTREYYTRSRYKKRYREILSEIFHDYTRGS